MTRPSRGQRAFKSAELGPDTLNVTKRAMLWLVGLTALFFTFVAAVNVTQINVGGSFGSGSCKGLWSPADWFKSYCSDSLPPRLGVTTLGLVVLIICGYFAEKDLAKSAAATATGHEVRHDPTKDLYWCAEARCGFESRNIEAARLHRREPGDQPRSSVTGPVSTHGFDSPKAASSLGGAPNRSIANAAHSSPMPDTFKTCPDCAEQVREAARKCRFCGYRFDVTSSASSER